MTCWGEPVCAGAAVGREDCPPLPLDVAGPLPPGRSAMEAISSTRSGEKGLGCRSASSSVQRIALLVCLETRTVGCGSKPGRLAEDENR